MPAFKYDPARGSFKFWLLNMTRWRIADLLRKRQPLAEDQQSTNETTLGDKNNADEANCILPDLGTNPIAEPEEVFGGANCRFDDRTSRLARTVHSLDCSR